MKNRWTLTPDAFNRLLAWLSSDREEAGRKYEEVRQKLILFFTKRGHLEPEDLTDESLNRVAKKLESGEMNYSGDPRRDIMGFAKHVSQEDRKEPRPDPIEDLPVPYPLPRDRELLFRCLEQCMASLSEHSRNLVSRYYQEEGSKKILIRQLLADEENTGMQTLRTRICRILKPLRECFFTCIEKETAN
ncbi:MAG TPA: hypothetical protein VG649_21980 [Candidatus Angelobacter sp.]|jgi:hypothetical protein|nr:hypothetical protein [Candidatus Angelobacter sp.]